MASVYCKNKHKNPTSSSSISWALSLGAGASKNLSMSAFISALKISLAMNGNLEIKAFLLVASVMRRVFFWHYNDIVNQLLQLVVIETKVRVPRLTS